MGRTASKPDQVTGDLVIIAADGATTRLLSAGVLPSVIVTDLDGILSDILAANERGSDRKSVV